MFGLRSIVGNVKRVAPLCRQHSAKAPLVDVSVDSDGVAIVTMQRPPVNSLNLDLLKALGNTFDDLAKNKTRGMILTSAYPTVFSAGVDIMEMYKPEPARCVEFWTSLQDCWIKLFGSPYPTVAAINGHAPAGGCLLAMSCEYRVMATGKFTIGLNETALGIVPAKIFVDSMSNTISNRQTELALTTGKLFTAEEALKVGLVDETAADKADCIVKSKLFLKRFDKIVPQARTMTKLKVRGDKLTSLTSNRKEDLNEFLQSVKSPENQASLDMYMKALKAKGQK